MAAAAVNPGCPPSIRIKAPGRMYGNATRHAARNSATTIFLLEAQNAPINAPFFWGVGGAKALVSQIDFSTHVFLGRGPSGSSLARAPGPKSWDSGRPGVHVPGWTQRLPNPETWELGHPKPWAPAAPDQTNKAGVEDRVAPLWPHLAEMSCLLRTLGHPRAAPGISRRPLLAPPHSTSLARLAWRPGRLAVAARGRNATHTPFKRPGFHTTRKSLPESRRPKLGT